MQLRPNCLVNDDNSQASVRHPSLRGGSGGGEEKGGEGGSTPPPPPHSCLSIFSLRLFSPSGLSHRPPPLCCYLAAFSSHQTLIASVPHFPYTPPATLLPFPSIRLPFLRLCVLRKKLIMFLISRVFQSPSKRDERETGRQATEVVVVGEGGG